MFNHTYVTRGGRSSLRPTRRVSVSASPLVRPRHPGFIAIATSEEGQPLIIPPVARVARDEFIHLDQRAVPFQRGSLFHPGGLEQRPNSGRQVGWLKTKTHEQNAAQWVKHHPKY